MAEIARRKELVVALMLGVLLALDFQSSAHGAADVDDGKGMIDRDPTRSLLSVSPQEAEELAEQGTDMGSIEGRNRGRSLSSFSKATYPPPPPPPPPRPPVEVPPPRPRSRPRPRPRPRTPPPPPPEDDDSNAAIVSVVALPFGIAAAAGLAATAVGVASAAVNAAPISPPSTSGVLSVTPLPVATPVTAAVAAALGGAIVSGDINAAAQVFIDSDDITGLVLGLQIPPGASASPSGDRNSNGDVVAIKAVALAALSAPGLEGKLTEVLFRAAILPSQEAGNTGLTLDASTTIDNIFSNLSNAGLLQRILDGDANTTLRKRLRQLLCVDCTDSRSWVCSSCWPSEFCVPFWFCQDLINGPRLVPASSFESTTTPL